MSEENGSNQKPNYDISKFKLTKILNNNTFRKTIALLGTFPDLSESDQAVIVFERNAFAESEVQTDTGKTDKSIFSPKTKTNVDFINNVYGSFQCIPDSDLNCIKTTVIYPATEKHIEKFSIVLKHLINETPTLYENITLPYLTSNQFSLDWVYNILEHKQETERIVYEDSDLETGFVIVPDLKWDGRIESLYLLAIVFKRNIKSLRDLNASHLPLLKNIRDRGTEAIEEKYGIPAAQIRMYIHYQPSFYHLHVHFNLVGNDAPGIWCEKSHMLETVINNLELLGDYYQKATIPFVAYEGNKLLDIYDENLNLRKKLKLDDVEEAPNPVGENDNQKIE